MTLPPASANRSSILALTSGAAPQPQSSPKVIVPSATSEIRTPVLPKSLYLMRFPHFSGSSRDLESARHAADSEHGVDGDLPQARGGVRVEGVGGDPAGGRRIRVHDDGFIAVFEVATGEAIQVRRGGG